MRTVDLQPLEALLPEGLPEVMREIATFHYQVLMDYPALREAGDDGAEIALRQWPDHCAEIALRQTLMLSDEFGGTYMPKGVVFRLTPRNRAMCSEFRGDYKVLARKYRLSEVQVRNIVDRWQKERFMARQEPLRDGTGAIAFPLQEQQGDLLAGVGADHG